MSDTPTPETDAASCEMVIAMTEVHCFACHIDFARKLERERDEARRERDEFCSEMARMFGQPLWRLGDVACFMGMQQATADALREENATFRNAQKACEDCDAITVAEVKAIREENARLRADKERLDWLEKRNPVLHWTERRKALSKSVNITENCSELSLRHVLDAAIKGEQNGN